MTALHRLGREIMGSKTTMKIYQISCAVCVLLTLSLGGCFGGSTPSDRPETYSATGTVTHNGQAVDEATVMFLPVDAGTAGTRAAVARTDASGKFVLTTFEGGDGALPGSYKVAIYKAFQPPMPEEETAEGGPGGGEPPAPPAQELLPIKYKDPNTSGLTAEVSASGANTFTFELTD